MNRQDPLASAMEQRWIPFKNNSSEDVPAYGVMRITGCELIDDSMAMLTIDKPSSTSQKRYLVNGPFITKAGDRNLGTFLESGGTVKYDSGTPAAGDEWGPEDDSWGISSNGSGFLITGGAIDSTRKHVFAKQVETSGYNYVLYAFDKPVQGWTSTSVATLAAGAAKNAWVGSTIKMGSESAGGIEYQASETDPATNGNYKVTKTGLYEISIFGHCNYKTGGTLSSMRAGYNTNSITSGAASAGTAHTHPVAVPNYDEAVLGPKLTIKLWRKPAGGGANAAFVDDTGTQRSWVRTFPQTPFAGAIRFPVADMWTVNLDEDDVLSFKFTWEDNTYALYSLVDDTSPFCRFTFLKATQDLFVAT